MIKRLARHGNSFALVIDKAILELLNITPKTPLDISTDGRMLVVAPTTEAKKRKRFNMALEKINQQYGDVLKRLAK
ncbi:MAG: AbrB/MazE/SpoVT family DNA-binding domain-containing protein [Candidatus Riflebacteria bacterium]|nr:AbrB/MazE/SpoVT family DNA-binding domain-containing protein [Candidatus Riflebacteria bacterium]